MEINKSKIIAANWKLHFSPKEAEQYFNHWNIKKKSPHLPHPSEVIFFIPPYCWQEAVKSGVTWGLQNVFFENDGAFTGENSPKVAKELGASWVLIGHSERRQIFRESNEFIKKKWYKVIENQLNPMLCIGETRQERDQGLVEKILQNQIKFVLDSFKITDEIKIAIAYEPVWSIGTGVTPSFSEIEQAHEIIKQNLKSINEDLLRITKVLYGGSVKPENAKSILAIPHVDGLLVGGASLNPEQFFAICYHSY